MESFDPKLLKQLTLPEPDSHKGQNGKLMIIGGSHLFHAASLWALQIATRVVDMVFYSSVVENNQLVHQLKKEFRGGIVVPREQIDAYIAEADAVLIGPGMMRSEVTIQHEIKTLSEIDLIEDEGIQSYYLTEYLLKKYPKKKWVIDAGALQMIEPAWLLPLQGKVVLTPHPQEFSRVFGQADVSEIAKKYHCTILLKGEKDVLCSETQCLEIAGGNAGMTKGGTGDILAGLIAALACTNDLFFAAAAGSYLNKKAGESLYQRVGYYFNASDLANEIPVVMKQLLLL
jgi:hydroxyethylthiazole kinase-like uncharacterized protein yjeF